MEERIGTYQVVSELGRGGMGVVYRARDEGLDRDVAIKVLAEHVSEDQSFVTRFVREARSAAALNHPNVVQVYAIGEHLGRPFFVMELVEGRPVSELLAEQGAMEPQRAAALLLQAASGIAAAHDRGILHRDLKPANLMVTPDGRVKVADFGLALMPRDATRLTTTGSLMGTPGYLAPEQCKGEEPDIRTDIYSLGMTFYEMLTGEMPFKGDSPFALVKQIVEVDPPDVAGLNPRVDPELKAILQRMIAKERGARFSSCHELVAALEQYLQRDRDSAGSGVATAAPSFPRVPGALEDRSHTVRRESGEQEAPTVLLGGGGGGDAPTVRLASTEPVAPPPPPAMTTAAPDQAVSPEAAAAPAALVVAEPQALTRAPERRRSILPVLIVVGALLAVVAGAALLVAPRAVREVRAALGLEGRAVVAEASGGASTDASEAAATELGHSAAAGGVAAASGEDPMSPPTALSSGGGEEEGGGSEAATVAADSGERPPAPLPSTQVKAPPVEGPRGSGGGGGSSTAASRGEGVAVPGNGGQASAPPPAPPLPAVPSVAVVARGERLLATAVEERLEAGLAGLGVRVLDEGSSPALGELLAAGQGATWSDLAPLLAAAGVDVAVVVDVELLSERTLSYLGRTESAWTSRVQVHTTAVRDGEPLAPGWSERVEYTAVSAEREAEHLVEPRDGELAGALSSGWAAYRRRVGGRS